MMEGFTRHEKTTGQNPLEMAKQQNEMIQAEVKALGQQQFEAKLETLRQQNAEAEEELERQRRELEERRRFCQENGPPQVRQQIRSIFKDVTQEDEEPRFVEIDE